MIVRTDRVRGALAGAGLAGVVLGVPCLLVWLAGNPPHGIPPWHQIRTFIGRPISNHAILQGIALAGWALWLLFTVAVVLEIAAVARHRAAPSAGGRGLRIPGFQGLAGALVVAVLVLAPGRPGTAPALPAPPPTASPAPPVPAPAIPTGPIEDTAPPGPKPTPYVVQRYDSPWLIAERHLGDGMRWREITDDAGRTLVNGQVMVEAGGRLQPEATARIIYPGQVLLLPSDAAPDSPPTAPQPSPPPPVSTLWEGTAVIADGMVTSATDGSSVLAVTDMRPLSHLAPLASSGGRTPVPASEILLGVGLAASAVLNLLAVRRRRQGGQASTGRRVPLPDAPARKTEATLRTMRRDDLVGAVDAATSTLAIDLARSGHEPPPLAGLIAADHAIEIVVGRPSTPPDPWVSMENGSRWQLPIDDLRSPGASAQPALLPALVPIGTVTGSEKQVLINLEAAGVTSVGGHPERARGFVQTAAVALAGLPWSRNADVALIGFGEVLAAGQPHVRVAPRLQDLGAELRATAMGVAARLAEAGTTNLAAARLAVGGDGLMPTIIICVEQPNTEEIALLHELCRQDSGVTALVAGEVGASCALDTADDHLFIPDLGLVVHPATLPVTDLAAVHQILHLALGPAADRDVPPYRELEGPCVDEPSADPTTDPRSVPSPAVTANVVGPIDLEGLTLDFRRPHAKETAVYLAMHPRGVAEHQLDEAIWPERHLVKSTTRDPVVSAARRALGGTARMPHAQGQGPDKRYRTTDEVGTDWQRFCVLTAHGRRSRSVDSLGAALALVRGRPFADVLAGPGYSWLHLEGHLHHMEAEIVDTADLACQLLLDRRDPVAARWAANQGLRAAPYAERLWVRLMAVADALGEAQEVERILAEMDRRLDLDGDYSQLHPDTISAYRRYSRRSRRPG